MFVVNDPIARATFDALADHVALLDSDGCVLEINRAWRQFAARASSHPRGAVVPVGRDFVSLHHGEVKDAKGVSLNDGLNGVFHGERESFVYEYSEERDGQKFLFEVRVTSCKDCDPVCAVVVRQDISARRELENEREEIARELWAQQGLFGQVLRQMPSGVIIAEAPSGKMVMENARVAQLLRHPFIPAGNIEEYRQYRGFYLDGRAVPPEEYPLARSLMHGETVSSQDIEYLCGDGVRRTFRLSSAPIRDRDDKIVAAVTLFNDVTEQRRHEEELRRSEERYQLAAAAGKVGVWEWEVGAEELFLAPNLKALLGYSEEELPDRMDAWCSLIHPDDKDKAIAATQEHLDGNTPQYEVEVRRRHKDGEYRWFLARGYALRRENGEPYLLVGSDTDITEHKRHENLLRESEERLRLGLDAGDTGTWDWDILHNRLSWSERVFEFHGIRPEEFSGTVEDFVRVVHPDDVGWVQQEIQRCIEEKALYQAEFRVVHQNGDVRWLTTTGKVFYDEDGRPRRMLGATTDITQRRHAEEERARLLERERAARAQAEAASRAKDEFLATLSHELRTPLNSILGWANLLRTGQMNEDEARDATESIERNARAQAQIIEDLLDMSRIMSGKVHLHVQSVQLEHIVDAAIETVRPAAQAKAIELIRVLESVPPVQGDANRLQQVLWNLLSNAIKFTPRAGHVEVQLAQRDEALEISVRDSGEGIAPEFLPHVFERFRQADSSSTRRFGGLGLGLSIVKQLVELHGGAVSAHSDGAGQGAVFGFTLPLLSRHRPEPETAQLKMPLQARSRPDEALPSLQNIRILVVDDEPDTRLLIQRVLEGRHAQVEVADSAAGAMQQMLARDFDVLVSDIGMPGEDGYSLIQKLRTRERNSAHYTPALALTAFVRAEDRLRAIRAGFQMHLSKPIEPDELVRTIACLAGITTG